MPINISDLSPSWEEMRKQLDVWIAEDGEISKRARIVRARLTDPDDWVAIRTKFSIPIVTHIGNFCVQDEET